MVYSNQSEVSLSIHFQWAWRLLSRAKENLLQSVTDIVQPRPIPASRATPAVVFKVWTTFREDPEKARIAETHKVFILILFLNVCVQTWCAFVFDHPF